VPSRFRSAWCPSSPGTFPNGTAVREVEQPIGGTALDSVRNVNPTLFLLASLLVMEPVSPAAVPPPELRLQAGDVVRIVVPGLEAIGDRTLDPQGMVDLGRLGVVDLAGCTVAEASTRVAGAAALALRDVERVDVRLVRRGLLVEVTGLVARPGLVSLPPGADVWEGLAAAGGVVDGADLRTVQIRRGPHRLDADVRRWLGGVGPWLPALETGDVVFVAALPEHRAAGDARPLWRPSSTDDVAVALAPGVNVLGGVTRPGRVPLAAPLPLLEVLALAGGPATDGDLRRVTLVREAPGLSATTTFDVVAHPAAGASRVLVRPGDTVIVGRIAEDPTRVAVQALANVALIAGVIGVLVGLLGQTP
jgi:polysaccharide biosynthesis/export protein